MNSKNYEGRYLKIVVFMIVKSIVGVGESWNLTRYEVLLYQKYE